MNNKIKFLLLMLFAAFVVSCHKDDFVDIDTLSKYGDRYYGGQEIPVWVGVDTHEFSDTEYKWECSGGTFLGPTNKVRAVWVAPFAKGDYEVKCTVTCGRESETRRTVMNVTDFYYADFGLEPADDFLKVTNNTMKYSWTNNELLLTSSYATIAYSWINFSDKEFKQPFQTSVDMAWRTTWNGVKNPFGIRLGFARPASNPDKYYRYIEMRTYPRKEKEMTAANIVKMDENVAEKARLQRIIDDNYLVQFDDLSTGMNDADRIELTKAYYDVILATADIEALAKEKEKLEAEKAELDATVDADRIAEIDARIEEIDLADAECDTTIAAAQPIIDGSSLAEAGKVLLENIATLEIQVDDLAAANQEIEDSPKSYDPNVTVVAQQYNMAYGTTTSTTLLSTFNENFTLEDGIYAADALGMTSYKMEVDANNYLIVSVTPYGSDEADEVLRKKINFNQDLCLEEYAFLYNSGSNIYIDNIYVDYQK